MTLEEYFSQTEKAVKQLFEALGFYLDLLKDIRPPIFESASVDEVVRAEERDEWYRKTLKLYKASVAKQREYFGYTVSKATISGSILQIAFMGIKLLSLNSTIPVGCGDIVGAGGGTVRFCIGRPIRGVPIGLVVYAGRNQYNHMDEGAYFPVTTKVFDRLYTGQTEEGENYIDPAFDLSDRDLSYSLSDNVLAVIGWKDHNSYITDMKAMLR
jgi:hypothetical protein